MRKKRQTKPKEIGIRKAASTSSKHADDAWERLLKIRKKPGEEIAKGWQSE